MTIRFTLVCFIVLVAAGFLGSLDPAAAQSQTKSTYKITGCLSYLQLSAALRKIISTEDDRLTVMKQDRMRIIRGAAETIGTTSAPAPSLPATAQVAVPAVDVDVEIGKLAYRIDSDRKLLSAIENVYRDCIKIPPPKPAAPEVSKRGR